jgi:hypothetical protein
VAPSDQHSVKPDLLGQVLDRLPEQIRAQSQALGLLATRPLARQLQQVRAEAASEKRASPSASAIIATPAAVERVASVADTDLFLAEPRTRGFAVHY